MTDEELDRWIHENIFKECWHSKGSEKVGEPGDAVRHVCPLCGDQWLGTSWNHRRVYYTSTIEAAIPLWEYFGFTIQPSGQGTDGKIAWWRVGFTGFADHDDMSLFDPNNPTVEGDAYLPRAIAKAAKKAWEARS